MKRAGVDLDGVLYQWAPHVRELMRSHFGFDPGESGDWDHLKRALTPDQWRWLWKEGVEQHGLFSRGALFEGAGKFVDWLDARSYELVVITSRPDSAILDTLSWLAHNRFKARELHIIGHEVLKGDVIAKRCDFYIDDKPEHVESYARAYQDSLSILQARPHNIEWRRNRTLDDNVRVSMELGEVPYVIDQWNRSR